jgi:hypothetical protein
MVRALSGDGIKFSKVKIGNGECPDDYYTIEELSNPLYETAFSSIVEKSQYVALHYYFNNTEVGTAFSWTEIGIFASDPDGGDDILYAYAHYEITNDEYPQYIPAAESAVFELSETVDIYIGDSENVSAILAESAEYLTQATLDEHINSKEPHPNLTAASVGLGEVPNVDTDHQTPTYELPETLGELESGEILTTAMGKIAAAVKALITHLKSSTIHVTQDEKTAWSGKAASSHTHSAADITTGTLGILRGGTGVTSYKELANKMGSYFGAPKSGTYTGDGTSKRLISLGFTPSAVILVDGRGRMCTGSATYGGIAVGSNGIRSASCTLASHETSWSSTHTALLIGTNGFYVNYASSTSIYTNTSGETYRYIAFA